MRPSSPGEAVLRRAELYRREAAIVAEYAPELGEVILRVVDGFESTVRGTLPEWLSIQDVEHRTGWSRRWLRERAQELEASGETRKTRGGQWEFRREVAWGLPVKPPKGEDISDMAGLAALGDRLGRER